MLCYCVFLFFFFKQKTAYEMRISDWSSDVCSSDLEQPASRPVDRLQHFLDQDLAGGDDRADHHRMLEKALQELPARALAPPAEIGRASCRERVCQYV